MIMEPTRLARVRMACEHDTFLKLAVMDVQTEGDLLVVLTDDSVPRAFVRRVLEEIWQGTVEVYCPLGIMTGACVDVAEPNAA